MASRRTNSRFGDCGGSTAVEFALLSPILLLIMVGVIDLGMAIYDTMRLAEATRIGAQYALGDASDTAGIQATVLNATTLPAAEVTAAVSPTFCECNGVAETCGGTCASGIVPSEFITVTASKTFQSILSYPWLETPMVLTQSTTVRIN